MKYLLFLIPLLLIACSPTTTPEPDTPRQEIIATRGGDVMPFDLDKTMHIFENLPNGGLQTVHAKDDQDTTQISLIQTHLQEEAARFQQGDFSDPAHIHGDMMPGLATLQDNAADITITYTPLDNGGQILYTAEDDLLITAIHDWFNAQLSDHGQHAIQDH
ncbi:MAG TPA: aspartate carbamoyltransferase [Anaerolineae bacterium]|nr:aspartate carbamoyltransferase [Anaerolineae bacterium]